MSSHRLTPPGIQQAPSEGGHTTKITPAWADPFDSKAKVMVCFETQSLTRFIDVYWQENWKEYARVTSF